MRKSALLATLTPDERFFFDHAGISYHPEWETVDEGRARGAISLAAAEVVLMEAILVADVGVTWEDDPEGPADFAADKRAGLLNDGEPEPGRIEGCYVWHGYSDRRHLASLWGIWDADADYRRVIRAELALECLDELARIIAEAKQPA